MTTTKTLIAFCAAHGCEAVLASDGALRIRTEYLDARTHTLSVTWDAVPATRRDVLVHLGY